MERLAGVLSPAWRVTQRLPDPEGAGHAWHGRAKGAGVTEMAFVAPLRFGDAVAFAQIGIVGLDGQIELEALRLYGLPEAAPALLSGTPGLPFDLAPPMLSVGHQAADP
jgi:hypothetical protein